MNKPGTKQEMRLMIARRDIANRLSSMASIGNAVRGILEEHHELYDEFYEDYPYELKWHDLVKRLWWYEYPESYKRSNNANVD